MLRDVFAESVRTLEPGGRIAVNVANLGRRPYRNLAADVTSILQDDLRLLLRGEVVWQKQRGASGSCAWGSFRSPANPVLRDTTERVIIASKGRFDRVAGSPDRPRGEPRSPATSSWRRRSTCGRSPRRAPRASATRRRSRSRSSNAACTCSRYDGDVVLDPFMGSGTTAVAAVEHRSPLRRLRHRRELRAPGARTRRLAPAGRPARPADVEGAWRAALLDEAGYTDLDEIGQGVARRHAELRRHRARRAATPLRTRRRAHPGPSRPGADRGGVEARSPRRPSPISSTRRPTSSC